MKPTRLPVTALLSTLMSTLPAALLAALPAGAAQAQQADHGVIIGVMTDMSGVLSDLSGAGSLTAVQMAVEDFQAAQKGSQGEISSADHQYKPEGASRGAGPTPRVSTSLRTCRFPPSPWL